MGMRSSLTYVLCAALTGVVLAAAGCDNKPEANKPDPAKPAAGQAADTKKPATMPAIPVAQAMDWCREHAMPESVCVQCHDELAAGYKAKGDWCKEHGLPDSQCFAHHPELKEKFAAAFKAKYGKEPPAVEKEAK